MISIEQKYKDLYNTDGGKKIRLIFYKEDYTALYPSETLFPADDLFPREMGEDAIEFEIADDKVDDESLSITESLCSDEDLNFGACECAQMEITVSGLDKNIIGKEFLLVEEFGGYEFVFGLYTVESTPKQEDKDTRKIIAYDRMKRFDVDVSGWYNALEFPMTLKAFRTSLCAFVGVDQQAAELVNDNISVTKTIEPNTLNGRDVLRYICQINGCFGNISKSGQFQYLILPKTDELSSDVDVYYSAESEEYIVPDIDSVMIRQEEGDIGGTSEGGGDNTLIVEGNILAYGRSTSELIQIANNIKTMVAGRGYVPATIEANGSPWYEVGDRISLETTDGVINTIIMKRTLSGIQGAMDTYESTGNTELTQPFTIESEILQLKGKSAVLTRTIEEFSNKLTDLEAGTETKFTQTAEAISAEVTARQNGDSELSSRITQTAEAISAKVSRADLVAAINLEVNKSGSSITLEAGHFVFKGSNFYVNADGSGGAANGNFTWDTAGNVTLTSAKISGLSRSSTLDCDLINVVSYIHASNATLEINGISGSYGDFTNDLSCSYIYAQNVDSSSDRRLKKAIKDISEAEADKIIQGLRPVSYRFRKGNVPGVGFIAQEVEQLQGAIPLTGERNGYKTIRYLNLIPLLVLEMQKQQREIKRLQEGVET